MDISIICPCFNEEKLIKTSLDDILNQISKFNLRAEVIVIDDSSTDGSFNVLSGFKDAIKIYRTLSNSGQGGTPRNIGISKSIGKFIIFYDFGDKIFLENISKYILLLDSCNADVAIFKHQDVLVNKITLDSPTNIFKENDYITNLTLSPQLISNPFSWSKIFRKKFIEDNNIFFGTQYLGQDKPFTWRAYLYCPKIIITSNIMYQHIFPSHKLNKMSQNNIKCVESIISIDSFMRCHFEKFNLIDLYNIRLINRDIFGIILSPNGVKKLLHENHYLEAFNKLGEFMNDLSIKYPGVMRCVEQSNKYRLKLLLNFDHNRFHNVTNFISSN
jgi:glycosyltransferase involved in cell wall biosynthesis